MTKRCEGHNVWMEERHSKTKVDEDGQPKSYFGHSVSLGKMCFGIKEEKEVLMTTDPEASMAEFTKDLDAENKHETLNTLDDIAKKEVEDKPMTDEQKMWRDKEDREAKREKEKGVQITKLTLAKSFIQANVDFDNAKQNNDLEKWTAWVLKG